MTQFEHSKQMFVFSIARVKPWSIYPLKPQFVCMHRLESLLMHNPERNKDHWVDKICYTNRNWLWNGTFWWNLSPGMVTRWWFTCARFSCERKNRECYLLAIAMGSFASTLQKQLFYQIGWCPRGGKMSTPDWLWQECDQTSHHCSATRF